MDTVPNAAAKEQAKLSRAVNPPLNPLRTEKHALALARKLFGDTAAVRLQKDAPNESDRAKYRAMSKADQEAHRKRHGHPLLMYRCTVGKVVNICGIAMFHVFGQGDTWAEAFLKAQNRQ